MNINLNLNRKCQQCFESERDHPVRKHFLYYEDDTTGNEIVWDCFDTKDEADDTLEVFILAHGISATYNEYKFRYSYDICNGEYK